MNYELRGLEYPKYANPELSALDYANETLDGDRQKFYEYQWFVSFMLLACSKVLQLRGGANWEKIVVNNIGYHKGYIQCKAFEPSLDVLDPLLRSKITEIQEKIRSHAPQLRLSPQEKHNKWRFGRKSPPAA